MMRIDGIFGLDRIMGRDITDTKNTRADSKGGIVTNDSLFPLEREHVATMHTGHAILAILLQILVDKGQINKLEADGYFSKFGRRYD